MIRLWISRRASVSIREQLGAQLLLGILSRKLAPRERLPSVRDLARRLKIHGNTVHAVYSDLARRGWVRAQPGSGVFVNPFKPASVNSGLDGLIRRWIMEAQARGHSIEDLQSALLRYAQPSRPARFVVVDSDPDLAAILAAEMSVAAGQTIGSAGCDQAARGFAPGTCVFVNSGHTADVSRSLGSIPFRIIHLRSMQDVLAGKERPTFSALIAVVSRSKSVLAWASTLLSALGFNSESVLLRDPHTAGWKDGLAACDIVAADVVTAAELPDTFRPSVFHIVSDETLADVRGLVTA